MVREDVEVHELPKRTRQPIRYVSRKALPRIKRIQQVVTRSLQQTSKLQGNQELQLMQSVCPLSQSWAIQQHLSLNLRRECQSAGAITPQIMSSAGEEHEESKGRLKLRSNTKKITALSWYLSRRPSSLTQLRHMTCPTWNFFLKLQNT